MTSNGTLQISTASQTMPWATAELSLKKTRMVEAGSAESFLASLPDSRRMIPTDLMALTTDRAAAVVSFFNHDYSYALDIVVNNVGSDKLVGSAVDVATGKEVHIGSWTLPA